MNLPYSCMLTLRLQTMASRKDITESLRCISQKYGEEISPSLIIPLHTPVYLQGPTSITYLRKGHKEILVIGEIHEDFESCFLRAWGISSFLRTIVEEKEVDFYLELSYINRQYPTRKALKKGSKIRKIYSTFRSCFQLDKKDCPYSSRFHYIDLRKLVPLIQRCNQIFYYMDDLLEGDPSKSRQELSTLMEGITLPRILKETKIGKQLEKIELSTRRFLTKMLTSSFSLFQDQHRRVVNDEKIPREDLEDFAALSIDIYTLARMFGNLRYHTKAITYTGNEHSRRYVSFLKSQGFSLVFQQEIDYDDSYKCLDITSLTPLLFNS